MVEERELDPKRVLMRVEHELQEAGLYVPFKQSKQPKSNDDGSALRSNNRMHALVNAARGMREAKLLLDDPMRRAEMGISEQVLIEQIDTDGNGARDDRKESFLFMLSEEAKLQAAKRLKEVESTRSAEPGAAQSNASESDAGVVGDWSASSPVAPTQGSDESTVAADGESNRQEASLLLASESNLCRSNDQVASFVLLWNRVVQAQLCEGTKSSAVSVAVGRVGDQLRGSNNKWSDGVLAADGNIYGIPCNATQVLCFDPRTQQATLVGDQLPGDYKWRGGVLAADGNIYGIPCNATQVLCFDPSTQQATLVGDQLPGGSAWIGGVLAADGNIYGIPCNATQVLCFDPSTQQATLVGDQLPSGWRGGVLAVDGNIYCIPFNATQVLCFDPRTQQATLVGDQLPGDSKWNGGVLAADGNIYGIPSYATQVLCFDPRTQQATLVGDQLPSGSKWNGGVLAADGNIYCIPFNATQVLCFDPRTQQATLVGDQLPGGSKWDGGVLAADCNIYGIPSGATQVLRLTRPLLEATAELMLELDEPSRAYARLENDDTAGVELQQRKAGTLRLDALGCGAYVRLVPQDGYELGMGRVGISVTLQHKLAAAPESNRVVSPGFTSVPTAGGTESGEAAAAGPAQPAPVPVVLLSGQAQYKIKLPEARFGVAADPSYKPMMDAHERECLARLCPFADGNPRRLKRIVNVFNVGRRVAELRRGKEWSGMADFKPKLLKFVIMLEQWPYRAPACLKSWLPSAA
eukprot:scaffold20955_cov66-Phaeocystis_antarctica.AAC.6